MQIISKVRVHKATGQKTLTIPKQKETEEWKAGELVEIKKVEFANTGERT